MSTSQSDPATYNLGPLDRIPVGEGRAFQVGTETIAVFRTRAGEVYAVQANCSHAGGPLADGLIGSGRLLCPLHGYAFSLASGEPINHGCPKLKTYHIELNDGEILVELEVVNGPDSGPRARTPSSGCALTSR